MECYLDNSATTAVSPEAAALALHIMTEEYGNPSSLHRRGFLAERAMTEARGQVAAVLHWWKGNNLLSIFTATILYMFLVQAVF